MLIGLFVRNIKAYVNINFVPMIGSNYDKFSSNFITYIGDNGVGKSSILEALDAFFNNKRYIINKNVTGSSYNEKENKFPFVLPIFLLEKQKISELYNVDSQNIDFLEKISDYFWDVELDKKSSWIDFINLRNTLPKHYKEQYYLFMFGERIDINSSKPFFPTFANNDKFPYYSETKNNAKILTESLSFIKELYSYVYFPIEIEVESFTKLETSQMQRIIGKPLKDAIRKSLENVKIRDINDRLLEFLNSIKNSFNGQYEYKAISQKKINITENDLIEKVLEAYFEKKVLHNKDNKQIGELSAGEKRQALISIATAFLNESKSRDKNVIIAIDEPEASLHSRLCYEQFEKLHKASSLAQIFITTHWYGFLPIVDFGYTHFLNKNDNNPITFDSYLMYDYRTKIKKDKQDSQNRMPSNFILKSTNDLVQSIYYSLTIDDSYNWLIVEGITEKIYFEVFFKDLLDKKLRILPLGGFKEVKRVYEFLSLPIKEKNTEIKGKVFCLIDTDNERVEFESDENPNLWIKRLSHNGVATQIHLLPINDKRHFQTDIEQCLNVEIFKETYQALNLESKYGTLKIEHNNGNTNFIKNLNNTKIDEYFKANEGENKVEFAKKYIEILKGKNEKLESYIPSWVSIIKKFFGGQ